MNIVIFDDLVLNLDDISTITKRSGNPTTYCYDIHFNGGQHEKAITQEEYDTIIEYLTNNNYAICTPSDCFSEAEIRKDEQTKMTKFILDWLAQDCALCRYESNCNLDSSDACIRHQLLVKLNLENQFKED